VVPAIFGPDFRLFTLVKLGCGLSQITWGTWAPFSGPHLGEKPLEMGLGGL